MNPTFLEHILFSFGTLQMTTADAIDIAVVGFLFFRLALFFRGTRAVAVLYGLLITVGIHYLAGRFDIRTLHWLLGNFLDAIVLVVIILFQQDIRQALAQVGAGKLWSKIKVDTQTLDNLVDLTSELASSRTGALIIIEKSTSLQDFINKGVFLDAIFSKELLATIFYEGTNLHDGAVIVNSVSNKIRAAGCILPLSSGFSHRAELGTRHRAAMGITEETDAIAIVVSEEHGTVSVAVKGKIFYNMDKIRLKKILRAAWER